MESPAEGIDPRLPSLLVRRHQLTAALGDSPYDLILYLERALVHSDLGYPDLAAGDAYRALLLADEARDESFEYHDQAVDALSDYSAGPLPPVLHHGSLTSGPAGMPNGQGPTGPDPHQELAAVASVRCFQMLALNLLLCGCLKSAYSFCGRGLAASPGNRELMDTKSYIETIACRRLRADKVSVADLPDSGVVRREVYPWNTYEPDRLSDESLAFLNAELATVAPKCAAKVSELPVLLEGASDTDTYDIIPTSSQLGLFATADISAGETILREYSLLTASNRHKESTCDACGTELPPLQSETRAVSCPECYDTVFCDDFCFQRARELYHPAVCDKDVDSIAKDPDAKDADDSLYLLLLARALAMSAHQETHPLELRQVKYIWGDFLPSEANAINPSLNAGPPPTWTLPFSFANNIETPLHVLEKMDIDIYTTLDQHDVWVFNTLYGKFRGTASARKSRRDGRPDVAAVHPLWCLANHDCDSNVTWEWGGRMQLWARERRVVGDRPGGIKAGDEVFNHYCDVRLGVQERRQWARGSLGGWCMCQRCRDESSSMPNGVAK